MNSTVALFAAWTIISTLLWFLEIHYDNFNSDFDGVPDLCKDNNSFPYQVEKICLIVMVISITIMIVMVYIIAHSTYPSTANHVNSSNPSTSCNRTRLPHLSKSTLIILCTLWLLTCSIYLFGIEWYFKIIYCKKYHILLYSQNYGQYVTFKTSTNYIGLGITKNHSDFRDWSTAADLCDRLFASNLASVHSDIDAVDILNARSQPENDSWIGLMRHKNPNATASIYNYNYSYNYNYDSNWSWTWQDGTEYDYSVNWDSEFSKNMKSTHGTLDCVMLNGDLNRSNVYVNTNYTYNHTTANKYRGMECDTKISQLICDYRKKYWPLGYYQTKQQWTLQQIVAQLYYYAFIVLYFCFYVFKPLLMNDYVKSTTSSNNDYLDLFWILIVCLVVFFFFVFYVCHFFVLLS